MDRLNQFFSGDFYAPHGFCFLWLPEIVWLHVISDLMIALSYFSIPVALWYFAKKRPDMPFRKIFILFATFITLCGLTHIFSIVVLWLPFYGLEGLLMLATGIVSALTAIAVWKIMPSALTLPSPTELQQINNRLIQTNAEIEEIVQTRTRELESTNAQLMLSQVKAEEASQAKSDFLANMSHEIRTPMNVILGISRILKDSQTPPGKQSEFLKTLHTSAESLMTLINDILDLSKIESGAIELESKPFSIAKLVHEMGVIFQFQADEKDLVLSKNIVCACAEKRFFIGDANRLRQVLINLIGNAIKFTNKGTVSIDVMCEELPGQDYEEVTIVITDTGIGISQEKIDHIFEKFVQADTSTTRKYGGSGLGLTISKNLIEKMGGKIEASSVLGEGTKFTVIIPLRTTAED